MNNQTAEQLKRIEAKKTLGLPTTAREDALYTLYGQPPQAAEAATIPEQTRDDFVLDVTAVIVAALADVLSPIVDAVVDYVCKKVGV